LVRQEPAQEVFIKSIFGKNMEPSTRGSHHTHNDNETDEGESLVPKINVILIT